MVRAIGGDGKAESVEELLDEGLARQDEELAHEEMLMKMFNFKELKGKKVAVSMNDGNVYDGTVDGWGNEWGGVIYMKEVDIRGSGTVTKPYLPLRIDSMSTWWPTV